MCAVLSTQTYPPTLVLIIKLVLLKIVNMSQISGEHITRKRKRKGPMWVKAR